jgi:hypothetical protein
VGKADGERYALPGPPSPPPFAFPYGAVCWSALGQAGWTPVAPAETTSGWGCSGGAARMAGLIKGVMKSSTRKNSLPSREPHKGRNLRSGRRDSQDERRREEKEGNAVQLLHRITHRQQACCLRLGWRRRRTRTMSNASSSSGRKTKRSKYRCCRHPFRLSHVAAHR